jgi:hypothetical protein
MKHYRHILWLPLLAVVVGTLCVPVNANDRYDFPEDIEGIPMYARSEWPFPFHTDDWAIINWYRSPEWVLASRSNFNLLDFYDQPYVFDAPLYVEGFVVRDEPLGSGPPIFMNIDGLPGMPAWIVAWPELQDGIANGKLTIRELLRMDSLRIGEATFFHETLHPGGTDHPVTHTINATGVLEDGATFQYHFAHGYSDGITVSIKITEP